MFEMFVRRVGGKTGNWCFDWLAWIFQRQGDLPRDMVGVRLCPTWKVCAGKKCNLIGYIPTNNRTEDPRKTAPFPHLFWANRVVCTRRF